MEQIKRRLSAISRELYQMGSESTDDITQQCICKAIEYVLNAKMTLQDISTQATQQTRVTDDDEVKE